MTVVYSIEGRLLSDPEIEARVAQVRRSLEPDLDHEPAEPHLQPQTAGGTSKSVTEDQKTSGNGDESQNRDDIRSLLNWGGGGFIFLLLAIGGLYLHTDTKFDAVNAKFETVNAKFDAVNARLTAIEVQQAKSEATINGKLDVLLERGTKK